MKTDSLESQKNTKGEQSFLDLGLSRRVAQGAAHAGYTIPTPIQAATIPAALKGRDVLGIAQTGTGKTASFALPVLTKIETGRVRARMPRVLILEPTRELAAQIEKNFIHYSLQNPPSIALLIGGTSMEEQKKKLKQEVSILIATPGRLVDHFERGQLLLNGIEVLVIDEADRMLDMGFIPDIRRICSLIPPGHQTLLFSATLPKEIHELTQEFLNQPVEIKITEKERKDSLITQCFVSSENTASQKRKILRTLIEEEKEILQNAIIFCNRKSNVSLLCTSLVRHHFNAGGLHGDMAQKSRTSTLENFREGKLKFLVASDIAARGLDIPEVSHVFNYDVPIHPQEYIHRIGRTGRAGRSGKSFTIVTPKDMEYMKPIEKLIGKIPERKIGETCVEKIEKPSQKPKPKKTVETSSQERERGFLGQMPAFMRAPLKTQNQKKT